MNRMPALLLLAACALGPGRAMASPCGAQAATMLRRFGLTDINRPVPPFTNGTSSAASTEPSGPGGVGGVPITTAQQQSLTELLKRAISADGRGDRAACEADLDQAQRVMR